MSDGGEAGFLLELLHLVVLHAGEVIVGLVVLLHVLGAVVVELALVATAHRRLVAAGGGQSGHSHWGMVSATFFSAEGFTRILSKYFESSFIAANYGDRGEPKQASPLMRDE